MTCSTPMLPLWPPLLPPVPSTALKQRSASLPSRLTPPSPSPQKFSRSMACTTPTRSSE
ncbi:hypothetical protein LEMLEM_LOCUS16590 [Lemmus lemmus]